MFKQYLKTAWRSIFRNKSFSVINISGLAIGMASVILIGLWLQNMISTDRFYSKENQLYILCNRNASTGNVTASQWTPRPLGVTLLNEQPQVEQMTRIAGNNYVFNLGDKQLKANGSFVDTSFFSMFDMNPLKAFSSENPLAGSDKIVLTQSFSKALFGADNPLGKTLRLDNKFNVTVSGIIKDLPNNTQFDFDFLLSWDFEKLYGSIGGGWGNNSFFTYIQLRPNTDLKEFNNKIK